MRKFGSDTIMAASDTTRPTTASAPRVLAFALMGAALSVILSFGFGLVGSGAGVERAWASENEDAWVGGTTNINVYMLSHTVTYDPNGADEDAIEESVYDGAATELPLVDWVFEQRTFKEWNTSSDGSGEAMQAGDDMTVYDSVTLYAIYNDHAPLPMPSSGMAGLGRYLVVALALAGAACACGAVAARFARRQPGKGA